MQLLSDLTKYMFKITLPVRVRVLSCKVNVHIGQKSAVLDRFP